MKSALRVMLVAALAVTAATVVACGGGGDSGGGGTKAASNAGKLSDKPTTLTFLWFEWPPAHALEELGKE